MTISAKIIKRSTCPGRPTITTWELEYPRFILAEVNTHRMLSKNSASSRAIPTKRMIELIMQTPAQPVHWGKNQPGMQAREEFEGIHLEAVKASWMAARDSAVSHLKVMDSMGIHKQIANRVVEPYCVMKTVLTGTEFANLEHLRHHEDAQPEFNALLEGMKKEEQQFHLEDIVVLAPNEWHVPYVHQSRENGEMCYWSDEFQTKKLEVHEALKLSASCCAQVSYRRLDDSLEKAFDIYNRLINSDPAHMSPVEHQATPMQTAMGKEIPTELGVTHLRKDGSYWSGNLKGWIQHRQVLPNEAKW
jgi:hypothetical protein